MLLFRRTCQQGVVRTGPRVRTQMHKSVMASVKLTSSLNSLKVQKVNSEVTDYLDLRILNSGESMNPKEETGTLSWQRHSHVRFTFK